LRAPRSRSTLASTPIRLRAEVRCRFALPQEALRPPGAVPFRVPWRPLAGSGGSATMGRCRLAVGCWIAPAALMNVGGLRDRVNLRGGMVFAGLGLFSRERFLPHGASTLLPGATRPARARRRRRAGRLERRRPRREGGREERSEVSPDKRDPEEALAGASAPSGPQPFASTPLSETPWRRAARRVLHPSRLPVIRNHDPDAGPAAIGRSLALRPTVPLAGAVRRCHLSWLLLTRREGTGKVEGPSPGRQAQAVFVFRAP